MANGTNDVDRTAPIYQGPPSRDGQESEAERRFARFDIVAYYDPDRAQWRTGIFWADTGLSLHLNDMEYAYDLWLADQDVRPETDCEHHARIEKALLAQYLD